MPLYLRQIFGENLGHGHPCQWVASKVAYWVQPVPGGCSYAIRRNQDKRNSQVSRGHPRSLKRTLRYQISNKPNSASKHSEVWVSFNPLQWQAPSYPDYSKKKKRKKKLLVIRSGCVELSKRRKLRLIIISKINRLKSNSDIHCVFEIQDFLPGGWPQGSVLRKVKLHLKKDFL